MAARPRILAPDDRGFIPGLLNANVTPPLTVTDSGSLSSWGNDSLWQ